MSVTRDIIVNIATDLDANAGLPEHGTVRGRRPRAILPQDCPLLVVWLLDKNPSPQTSELFDSTISVGVSWHEETVVEAQTLIDDEEISFALMDALERIEARIRRFAVAGIDVDAAYEVLPGEVIYLPAEMQSGLVEGYAAEITVQLTEGAA